MAPRGPSPNLGPLLNHGGYEYAQHGVRMRPLLLCPGTLACPSLPSLLPTRLHFPDHQFPSCSVFQSGAATAHFKAHQLLSLSNNMSADAELFLSPVTQMAISIGFCWGTVLRSPELHCQCMLLISKASLRKASCLPQVATPVSSGLPERMECSLACSMG